MNFQSLLIVTYGRSGSTLLQGLCNALPGCLIRGENYNFCHGLFNAWTQLTRTHSEFGGPGADRVESPWFGASGLDPQGFLADARALVERQLLGGVQGPRPACLGFKEIRYLPDALTGNAPYAQRLTSYLDFLAQLMSRPAFIFLTRDPEQVSRSAWWRDREPAKVRQLLSQFAEVTRGYQNPASPAFHLDYAELLANGEAVGRLFDFLGVRRNPALVSEVLGRDHSYSSSASAPPRAPLPGQAGQAPRDVRRGAGGAAMPQFLLREPLPPALALLAPDQPTRSALGAGDLFVWDGVAVPTADATALSLALHTPAGVMPLAWGSPSPWAAARLPANPWAAKARYKGPPVALLPGQSCTLLLMEDGVARPVAELRRDPA